MAIFQESEGGAHAERAIDAALGLFAAAEQLNRDNTANPLGLHMGLNSGCALVGSTRMPTGAVDLPLGPARVQGDSSFAMASAAAVA